MFKELSKKKVIVFLILIVLLLISGVFFYFYTFSQEPSSDLTNFPEQPLPQMPVYEPVPKIKINGRIEAPAEVRANSLTVVSLAQTSVPNEEGNFSTQVYEQGVTLVAAIPANKDFGLINITVTGVSRPISQLILNASSTAVSMVFITPFFITNEPADAQRLLSVIEQDPKVDKLARIIKEVFNQDDPLSNPEFQQAFKQALESVWNSLESYVTAVPPTDHNFVSAPQILYLPKLTKDSFLPFCQAADKPSKIHPTDQDYVQVEAGPKGENYYIKAESKNGGSVDWIGYVSQLDTNNFDAEMDFVQKAYNNRTVYSNEGKHIGELYIEAKSYFRYAMVSYWISTAAEKVFGGPTQELALIPADQDGIYLIRAYSGGWGKATLDSEEKSFVQEEIWQGKNRDNHAMIANLTMAAWEGVSAVIDLRGLGLTDLNKTLELGMLEAVRSSNKGVYDFNDCAKVFMDSASVMLAEIINAQANSFFEKTTDYALAVAKLGSQIFMPTKFVKAGKVVDRVAQAFLSATPLETSYVVIGDPFYVEPKNQGVSKVWESTKDIITKSGQAIARGASKVTKKIIPSKSSSIFKSALTDAEKVKELIEKEVEALNNKDYRDHYEMMSPNYREKATYEEFKSYLEVNNFFALILLDTTQIELTDIKVEIKGEWAYASYKIKVKGEVIMTEENDIFRKVSGRWYDVVEDSFLNPGYNHEDLPPEMRKEDDWGLW